MVAGIPVPSLITTILMGIANGDILDRWYSWLERQIKDPDVSTTSYFTYNRLEPVDVYADLYDRLFRHFTRQAVLVFKGCSVVDIKILNLEDHSLNVRYFVRYRYP